MEGIERGVPIDFTGNRSTNRTCRNLRSALDSAATIAAVSKVIAKDVASGKKAGPFDAPPFIFFSASPIGAVPKRNSTAVRVIHHLSYPYGGDSINASITEIKAPLGRFDQAIYWIQKLGRGCWLVKLDVEAAYKQVPVRAEDWPLIGFMWEGKYYYERVLPFGLKSSCRLWELYANALQRIIERVTGIKSIVHYIDDFLFVIETRDQAQAALDITIRVSSALGVPFASDKTEGPATCLTFLGIELDTVAMTASLSAERLHELQSLLRDWEGVEVATVQELDSLHGKLNWATNVVRPGRSYLRRLIDFTSEAQRKGPGPHRLTKAVRRDLKWWGDFAPKWNGISLLYDQHWSEAPLIQLFTDACETGYGGVFGDQWFHGNWTPKQYHRALGPKGSRSMPFLELLALVLAAATWGNQWRGKRITFRSDCMPVVQALDYRKRSSKIERLNALVRHLTHLAAIHGFDFRCHHIPGITNIAADRLSRQDVPAFRQACPTARDLPSPIGTLPPFASM